MVGIVSGAAMALGPTLGGFIASTAGWRWIFLLNLPVCLLAAWAVPRVVGESRDVAGRPLDWVGVALLTLALAAPIQALLRADGSAGWRWAGVAAGIAFAAAFVVRQRGQPRPMLDFALFGRRGPVGIGCVLLALSVGYWAALVYLPLFLTAAFGLSPERTGIAMLAATLPMLVLPPVGVKLARRWGWGPTFASGLFLVSAGIGVMAAVAALSGGPVLIGAAVFGMALAGGGAGLINSQVSGALVAMAPAAQAGMASGIATTLRQSGFAVGIALLAAAAGMAGRDGGAVYSAPLALAAFAAAAGALAAAVLLREAK